MSCIDHSPGPCDYSPKILDRGAKYSFSRKTQSQRIKTLPGPGSYTPTIVKKSPSAFMGSALKSTKTLEISPGPGDYNLKRDLRQRLLTFPKSQRMQSMKQQALPGPGDYSPKITYQTPRINKSRASSLNQSSRAKYSIDLSKNRPSRKDFIHASSLKPEKIIESKARQVSKDYIGQIRSYIKNLTWIEKKGF